MNNNDKSDYHLNVDRKGNKQSLPQREKIKLKIMNKYNISESRAEEILVKLEKKSHDKKLKNEIKPKNSLKNLNSNELFKNQSNRVSEKKEENSIITSQQLLNNHDKNGSHSRLKLADENSNSDVPNKNDIEKQEKDKVNANISSQNQHNIQNSNKETNDKNVDIILSDIIPDYEKNISIEVNHVYLTFETEIEKIDTIKEAFIKTLNRTKSESILVNALNDISFKIYQGEKIGIIGYNGAGKSTLLSVISGIYPPDKGYVKTSGNISPLLSLGAGFDYNYSGRKNIYFNGAVLGYDKEFLESKIDEIIEFSELKEYIDIPIKNYSSGMLAKLGFSIATILEPDILIIDEILGVGDVNFRKKSADKIKSLMDGGTTVLLVSHSIPQIRELCDKAIWIDNGCLREFGEVNLVCDHYLKDAEKATNEQLANIQFR